VALDRGCKGSNRVATDPAMALLCVVYTRANLRVRLFPCTVSALFDSATLQTVESHEFLRSVEEGGQVIPLNNKGLTKLHLVIYV